MFDDTHDLFIRGIAAAKARDFDEAKNYLQRALQMDPMMEHRNDALYYLAEICGMNGETTQQHQYLEDILASNPGDARVRRQLAILDGKLNPEEVIDPDRFQQPVPADPKTGKVDRFICTKCGGRMAFSPDGQGLVCDFCNTLERNENDSQKAHSQSGEDFLIALSTARGHSRPVTAHQLTCKGCGAQFVIQPDQLTRNCPYCFTPYALAQIEEKEIVEPDEMIPFKVAENQAKQELMDWFTAHKFKTLPKVSHGIGWYLPVWVFNLGGVVQWTFQKSGNHTNYPRKITSVFDWLDGEDSFGESCLEGGSKLVTDEGVLVLATSFLPQSLWQGMWAFDLTESVPFDNQYLAGWMAETYNVTAADASLQAREYALNQEREAIQSTLPSSASNLVLNSTQVMVDTFKLVLLPVWLTNYSVGEKVFNIIINGQNGQVFGEY